MKTVSGKWQNLDGTPVANGRVFFKLSQDAVALGATQVSTALISFNLDANGVIVTNSQLWANDELSPTGTTYSVSVLAAGGGPVWGAENLNLTGTSPININNAVPTVQDVMLFNPVVTNPTATQTITGHDLNISGANLNVTGISTVGASVVTGNEIVGGSVTAGSASLGTPLPKTSGGTGISSTATFPASGVIDTGTGTTNKIPKFTTGASGIIGDSSITDNGTVVTFSEPINGATLTGTVSGNSVTLLNQQGAVAAITGNGGDQTLYAFTIPTNTIQAGKGFRVKWYGSNNGGAATLSLKLKIGSTTLFTLTIAASSNYMQCAEVFNNASVQNAQTWAVSGTANINIVQETFGTSAENFANAIAVTVTGSIANPNTFQGGLFMVELIQ